MGVYTILSLAYGATSTLIGLGLSSVVTKFVAESTAQRNKTAAASVYYSGLILSELTSIVIAVGFLLSKFPAGVSSLSNSPELSLISILFAVDVVASIGPIGAAAFYGLLEFRNFALLYAVYTGVRPWLVVFLVYEVGSLIGLMEGWVIADAAFAACVVFYLWRRLGPPVFAFDMKYLLRLSGPLYVAAIASFLYRTFDQIALIPLVPLSALGVYGAAVSAFNAYNSLISVFGSVLLPIYSELQGVRGPAALENAVRGASRYVSFAAMPLAFALLAGARPALTLFVGNRYAAGALPLAVLALGSTAAIISLSFRPILIVQNETLLASLTSLIPLPLSIGLALISIPRLGILGASIARCFSMLLSLILTWYFLRGKIVLRLDYRAIAQSVAASGLMALVMEAAQLLFYSRLLLPFYVAVGFLVYLLALRMLRAMRPEDMDLFRQMLGPRFNTVCNLLSRIVAR
jgi:O-antigen/teichoic acid export membrane protein